MPPFKAFSRQVQSFCVQHGWNLCLGNLETCSTYFNRQARQKLTKTACILNLRVWQSHFLANSIETQEMTSWLQNDRCLERLHKVYRTMFSITCLREDLKIRKLGAEAHSTITPRRSPPGCTHWTVGPDGENCNVEPFSSSQEMWDSAKSWDSMSDT